MLALIVRVAPARERGGTAELRDGSRTFSRGPVAASAAQAIAAQRGNPACDPLRLWGHPPFGEYRLLHHFRARPEFGPEYGSHILLFEPESGPALDAESFGRLALLAYGGAPGRDGRLRRTQGGLRLPERLLLEIVERLRGRAEMTLTIEPLHAPAWWQFWRREEDTLPLSETEPALAPAPADEASVMAALLADPALKRRPRRQPRSDEPHDRSDDRDERRERSTPEGGSASGEPFRGRGGEGAGAGASGGWDSAPARPAGVDQAGRIIAGAAAATAAAALIGQSAAAAGRDADRSGSDRAGAAPDAAESTAASATIDAAGTADSSASSGSSDGGGAAGTGGGSGSDPVSDSGSDSSSDSDSDSSGSTAY